jgi:hypothetical protein
VYTVVARTDGAEISADDAGVKLVVYDILRKYLRDKIIVEWSIEKAAPSASPAA